MKVNKKISGGIKLLLGVVALYFFSTCLLKYYNESKFAEPLQEVIERKDLDPSAFFYSDPLFMEGDSIQEFKYIDIRQKDSL